MYARMSMTRRARAARRTHDFTYLLIALALMTVAAAYAAFTGDFFGWDRLLKAGAHSWLFLGFIFAPCWVMLGFVGLAAYHWRIERPWVG